MEERERRQKKQREKKEEERRDRRKMSDYLSRLLRPPLTSPPLYRYRLVCTCGGVTVTVDIQVLRLISVEKDGHVGVGSGRGSKSSEVLHCGWRSAVQASKQDRQTDRLVNSGLVHSHSTRSGPGRRRAGIRHDRRG